MNKNCTFFLLLFFLLQTFVYNNKLIARTNPTVKGIVFYDKNENGIYDKLDKPLKNIAVSNGVDIAITNRQGIYELPYRDNSIIFLIKPRNWTVPLNENNIPKFHKTLFNNSNLQNENQNDSYLDSVNFPLLPSKEPNKFKILIFGDIQPRDEKEIFFMSDKIITELIGTTAVFGVALGDITFDNLKLYKHITESLSNIGIPMWYVPGNHDLDYSQDNSIDARKKWNEIFGPSWYSFSYGPVHFIVLDNIRWIVEGDKRYYQTGLGADQMSFLKNEINRLNKDQLLVIMAHIPYEESTKWINENEKQLFYNILSSHPNSVSMVAHKHWHYHHFINNTYGLPENNIHHMISIGAVCGAWWSGIPNEYGIPHAMMSDGTPNGYAFLNINKDKWKIDWKVAGKPNHHQMHIYAPDEILYNEKKEFKIIANIYNALPDANVKLKIGKTDKWIDMIRTPQKDPFRIAAKKLEKQINEVPWRKIGEPTISNHIWEATYKSELTPGVHLIHIISKDAWNEFEGKKLIYIK